jgi:hypothetical protein
MEDEMEEEGKMGFSNFDSGIIQTSHVGNAVHVASNEQPGGHQVM